MLNYKEISLVITTWVNQPWFDEWQQFFLKTFLSLLILSIGLIFIFSSFNLVNLLLLNKVFKLYLFFFKSLFLLSFFALYKYVTLKLALLKKYKLHIKSLKLSTIQYYEFSKLRYLSLNKKITRENLKIEPIKMTWFEMWRVIFVRTFFQFHELYLFDLTIYAHTIDYFLVD